MRNIYPIPEHKPDPGACNYLNSGGSCYWCCDACNLDAHLCYECRDSVNHFNKNLDHSDHACYSHKNGEEL